MAAVLAKWPARAIGGVVGVLIVHLCIASSVLAVVIGGVANAVPRFRRPRRLYVGGPRLLRCGATAAKNAQARRQAQQYGQGRRGGVFLFFV